MRKHAGLQLAAVLLLVTFACAQEAPKVELAPDYSFARYAPSASYTKGHSFNGGGGQIKFNIGQYFGIAADLQGYNSNTTNFNIPPNATFPNGANGSVSGNLFTYLFGPIVKFRNNPHVNPYLDVLLGAAHSNVYGNAYQTLCQPTASGCTVHTTPDSNGFALSSGGGIDIPINQHIDFRPGEFDYLYTRFTNIFNNAGQNNFRYLAGLNIKMGIPNPKMPTAACAASPTEMLPWAGPVKITASPADFDPKHTLAYGWESTGGKAIGDGASATVDTTSLSPGQYTVTADVTDQKKKKYNTATCSASFTVKAPRPPVVACSASPASVKAGEPVAITVSGSSPDQTAITKRSFSASSGSLKEGEAQAGSQPGEFTTVASLDTSNLPPGPINVNVAVTDVHGLAANCTANAEVVAPPAPPQPPAPTAQVVGRCDFKDSRRAARVDNTCKASLDGVALQLKNDPGSRLIIVGSADSAATAKPKNKNVDSVRAANVRDYFTKGEGKQQIDASRIDIRRSTNGSIGNAVQIYLVPANATGVQVDNTEAIDESTLPPRRAS